MRRLLERKGRAAGAVLPGRGYHPGQTMPCGWGRCRACCFMTAEPLQASRRGRRLLERLAKLLGVRKCTAVSAERGRYRDSAGSGCGVPTCRRRWQTCPAQGWWWSWMACAIRATRARSCATAEAAGCAAVLATPRQRRSLQPQGRARSYGRAFPLALVSRHRLAGAGQAPGRARRCTWQKPGSGAAILRRGLDESRRRW